MNPLSPYTPELDCSAEAFGSLVKEVKRIIGSALSPEERAALREARGSRHVLPLGCFTLPLDRTRTCLSRYGSGSEEVPPLVMQALLALRDAVKADPEKARAVLLEEIESAAQPT